MTKEQFIRLLRDIGQQMPDKDIRLKFLFNEFKKYGLSVFDGTKITNYYYGELKKQVNGEKSIFDYKVIRQNGTIGFVDNLTCSLKVTEQYFANLEDLLTVKRYDNVINNLNNINDFVKLFSGKYSGQSWPVGAIPETALEITEIELLFKYWKQIIQETINAAPDKQKEIDNFLNLCDMGISTILPKCKDPYENKELVKYWLSQYKALKIFVATFERHIPKTSAAEPLKEDEAEVETTEQKVRRLLAPLKENSKKHGSVIIENTSFEKLVSTYVNYIKKNEYPERAERFCIYGSNPEFYGTLKDLHDKFPLKVAGIGQALTYILSQNNQHGERGKATTPGNIEKAINNRGKS